jgi:hypothetical protein
MKYLLLTFWILFFSCSDKKEETTTDDNDTVTAVRFDGVYSSKKMENDNGDGYKYYLKFYKSGTVISVSSSGTAEEISKWFKPGHEMVSEGKYEIDEDTISFTVKSKYGSVKYNGKIVSEEKLKLHSKSLINSKESDITYSFVEE